MQPECIGYCQRSGVVRIQHGNLRRDPETYSTWMHFDLQAYSSDLPILLVKIIKLKGWSSNVTR
jgi:hypothetical protein